MKKTLYLLLITAGITTSCKKNSPVKTPDNKSTNNAITSFTVDSIQVGTTQITSINDSSKITLYVLQDANSSVVIPHISISDQAVISPSATTPLSLSTDNKYTYTVTSASGSSKKWYVQIKYYANLTPLPLTGDIPKKFRIYSDLDYNAYLTRNSGWNGGDGCYSHLLPDSTILWTFQDSFIGTVDVGRSRNAGTNKFARNAGILELKGFTSSFVQLNAGLLAQAHTWIEYDSLASNDNKELYWPDGAQVYNNTLQMILNHMVYNNSGGLDHASVDVAIFSLPDMKLQKILKNQIGLTNGLDLFKNDDGYTYIYGDNGHGVAVARAANNDITGKLEYYTDNGWASTQDSHVILTDRPSVINVFKDGGTYYYVTQNPNIYISKAISIYQSTTPIGPWTNKRNIYYEPTIPNVVTYNASLHQELSRNGELVLSYNTNPTDGFNSNFGAPGSADKYRPYFIRIYNWK